MDTKIDRISQDISVVKIKDVEQAAKLESLEEKTGTLTAKCHMIEEQLKKIETDIVPKKNMDDLFEKVKALEEAPHKKIISKVDFLKKAIVAGVALLLTGMVVSFGTVVWKLIINLDTIIQAIEKLRQGGY